MINLLVEKINRDIEMYQFVYGKTGSVKLDIRDIRELIEKEKKYSELYFEELEKNAELEEKIEKLEQELLLIKGEKNV